MIKVILQSNEFDPCNYPLKIWKPIGIPIRKVGVHSYTIGSMKCDSWASLFACTFVSPYLGCEPKAKITTKYLG